MKPEEFMSLGLEAGDKVVVQIGRNEPKVAVFDGYRCFKYTVRDFGYDLFPIFRMPAKNGGMLSISCLGKDHCVCHSFQDIISVRRYYTPKQIAEAVTRKNESLARIEPATKLRKEVDGRYGIYSVKTGKIQTVLSDEELESYIREFIEPSLAF